MLAPQVTQDPGNDVGPLDAGDNLDGTATPLADFDIDLEHALETPSPGHGAMLFGVGRGRLKGRSLAAPGRRDLRTKAAVGREHTMIAREVDAGPRDQGRQAVNTRCRSRMASISSSRP